MQMEKPRSLSQLLSEDLKTLPDARITLQAIFDLFHERGFGFFLLILALPMALPIPVPPGINIILALPLLFLTLQQSLGFHKIWMPRFVQNKQLSGQKFKALLTKTIPFLAKIEIIISPRLSFLTKGLSSNLIGIAGFIMALCITIPVPLSNTVPSFGIALMAIGVLMRDGLAVLSGMVIGLIWVSLLAFMFAYFGAEGFDLLKEWIKSLL